MEALLAVAVAEVKAEFDLWRHSSTDTKESLEDASLDVLKPDREHPLEHPELEVGVPLNTQLVGRYVLENLVDFGHHGGFVRPLNDGLRLERNERADWCERSW